MCPSRLPVPRSSRGRCRSQRAERPRAPCASGGPMAFAESRRSKGRKWNGREMRAMLTAPATSLEKLPGADFGVLRDEFDRDAFGFHQGEANAAALQDELHLLQRMPAQVAAEAIVEVAHFLHGSGIAEERLRAGGGQ